MRWFECYVDFVVVAKTTKRTMFVEKIANDVVSVALLLCGVNLIYFRFLFDLNFQLNGKTRQKECFLPSYLLFNNKKNKHFRSVNPSVWCVLEVRILNKKMLKVLIK